jgi:hypothetical protein
LALLREEEVMETLEYLERFVEEARRIDRDYVEGAITNDERKAALTRQLIKELDADDLQDDLGN